MSVRDAVLSVRDLRVRFGAAEALRGVTFDVERGSFTALVGGSGSGKSLTALSVAKLLPPAARASGSIVHRDRAGAATETLALEGEALRRFRGASVGYVFQDAGSALNPLMRVGEQIAEACAAHGADRSAAARRSAELLEAVRLGDALRLARAYPHELSGGQRQRVMIAIGLAAGPGLVIADEPTTALDASTEAAIVALLDDLRRARGLTVLFITHDLGLALGRADAAVILRAGAVEERLEKRDGFVPRGGHAKTLFAATVHGRTPKTYLEARRGPA